MFRPITLAAAVALSAGVAHAAGEAHFENHDFSFEGPFGSYDENQLQRGLQVFSQVCSGCHGIRYVPIRTLSDEGGPNLPEDQVRAYIDEYFIEVWDPEEQDYRAATPNDHFPPNTSVGAPDLSLMAKAREGGPDHIYSILTGYEEEPECALEGPPMDGFYNRAFANGAYPESCLDEEGHRTVEGSWIAMSQPLYGDDVVYQDGTEATLEQEVEDVSAFLMWAAEPHMMERKEMGFRAILMLGLLSVLLYLTNKRIWAPVKARLKGETPAE
ncbi:cytochrome c1 [Rhodobacterales bacterium HKCCE3408]|nr:cytochrome c1 [Rhodobacterales bacterium HKCCE3408]